MTHGSKEAKTIFMQSRISLIRHQSIRAIEIITDQVSSRILLCLIKVVSVIKVLN